VKSTWRWFGPGDPVGLDAPMQAGATGIVTSLHQLPDGEPWFTDAVAERQTLIAAAGLEWAVVESVPVSNAIKTRGARYREHLDNYKTSLRSLAANNINVVCYNFIPLVDWMRTDMRYPLKSGLALRFDMIDFAACDIFILKRARAADDYDAPLLRRAEERFRAMPAARREELERVVLAPLPGGTVAYGREEFFRTLSSYEGMSESDYRSSLLDFLREIVPVAEDLGIRMCIHPDDPPIDLFGLPRIAGSAAQLRAIFDAVPANTNGLTFCVGSLGVKADNDLPAMIREFGPRIHFAHLRNVRREEGNSFCEAEHLGGSSDMVGVLAALLDEEEARRKQGRGDWSIPMRPDHGHLMLDDIDKANSRPGYSAIGRLKGLAELHGAIAGLSWKGARHH
jgi:mannonate dehydratase